MKALILIISTVLLATSGFATDGLAETFDGQSKSKQQDGQEFKATYNSKNFLAWTAQEEKFLSQSTLDIIAQHRAADICHYFGFGSTKAKSGTVRMIKPSGENKYSVNYIQNGKLVVIADAGEGFMTHDLVPTVFTKVTCYL